MQFDSCLFAVLQLTRKMIHLSMGKAKCSHNGDQDFKALSPPMAKPTSVESDVGRSSFHPSKLHNKVNKDRGFS